MQDDSKGAQLAGSWGIREAFTAVIVTNLPMLFSLLRSALQPLVGSALSSSNKGSRETRRNIRTIGGGGSSRDHRGPPSANPLTRSTTLNQSEEHIMSSLGSQNFKAFAEPSGPRHHEEGIMVSNQVEVTSEPRTGYSPIEATKMHYVDESW